MAIRAGKGAAQAGTFWAASSSLAAKVLPAGLRAAPGGSETGGQDTLGNLALAPCTGRRPLAADGSKVAVRRLGSPASVT